MRPNPSAPRTASYKYDAEGRRVEKTVSSTTERFIRSRVREAEGSHLTSNNPGDGARYDMSHVVCVFDGSNNWIQNFVWNDEVDGIQVLEQADILDYDTDGNTTELTRSYYHRNALGSVMEITDANQATVVSYRYDPYGVVTITRGGQTQTTDPLNQHWAFTGRYFDEESDLYYYRARYHDPVLGRFLQRDPLGYTEGPSLYEYVASRPSALRDPSGCQDGGIPEPGAEDKADGGAAKDDEPSSGDGDGFETITGIYPAGSGVALTDDGEVIPYDPEPGELEIEEGDSGPARAEIPYPGPGWPPIPWPHPWPMPFGGKPAWPPHHPLPPAPPGGKPPAPEPSGGGGGFLGGVRSFFAGMFGLCGLWDILIPTGGPESGYGKEYP